MIVGAFLLGLGLLLLPQRARTQLKLRQATEELNQVHANVACEQCHVTEEKMPPELCLKCHQEIGRRAAQRRGLHGADSVRGKECWKCHMEHRGKAGDILGWGSVGGKATLDHAKVGFPLLGKHAGHECQKCHSSTSKSGRPTFLDTAGACAPCHSNNDPHQGNLGTDCLRCHTAESWKATRFDHNQHSRFPLRGKHLMLGQQQECTSCHPQAPNVFKPLPVRCGEGDCHTKDDVHKGTLGQDCGRCHSDANEWNDLIYAHNDPTDPGRFRLVGAHMQVRCVSCHKTDPNTRMKVFRGLPRDCEGCHLQQDSHRGDFGTRCGGCHEPAGWKRVHVEHEMGTQRFGGAHDRVPCATCHAGPRKLRGTGELCVNCHQRDDIHHNALGPRCSDCHTQQTFAGARFRHETVGCTLRGIHRALPCIDCHKGGNYAGLAPMCISCHRDDAMRAAGAGVLPELHVVETACTLCHNTITFRGARTRMSPPESVCQ